MTISTKKGGNFALVPEGDQILTVTECKLVPSGKPVELHMKYRHESGATAFEKFTLANEKAQAILGIRVDMALGGSIPEGTDIDISEIPSILMDKTFELTMKHVEKEGKTYVNVKFAKRCLNPDGNSGLEDDDDL